jgi:ribosomal protein S18 acetylase RimI-like enzyme
MTTTSRGRRRNGTLVHAHPRAQAEAWPHHPCTAPAQRRRRHRPSRLPPPGRTVAPQTFQRPQDTPDRSELWQLAAVDATHHALVAYLDGDPDPVAIARLVRDGRSAEIAFAVADQHQQRGIGSALTAELIADARAAGISDITALVASDNPAAIALLRRVLRVLDIRYEGPELSIRAAIA